MYINILLLGNKHKWRKYDPNEKKSCINFWVRKITL